MTRSQQAREREQLAVRIRRALRRSGETLRIPRGNGAGRPWEVHTFHTRTGHTTGFYRDLPELAGVLGVAVESRSRGGG